MLFLEQNNVPTIPTFILFTYTRTRGLAPTSNVLHSFDDTIMKSFKTCYIWYLKRRQLSYRKEDRAMRPIYGCPEKFRESSLRTRLLFPKFVMGFCSDRY